MYLSVEFVVGYGKRSHTGNVLSCISSVEIFNLIKYMIWKVSLNERLPPEMNICQDDSPLNDVKKYLDIKLKLSVWKFKSMKNKITKTPIHLDLRFWLWTVSVTLLIFHQAGEHYRQLQTPVTSDVVKPVTLKTTVPSATVKDQIILLMCPCLYLNAISKVNWQLQHNHPIT